MQNKTALIVDNSRTASQMLRLMLEREEFQVDVLGNAEEAVGYLQGHRPGIIFMDHLMPGMEGFNAVKEIKNSTLTAQIPIVMYTAKSGDLYVGQAQALGAVDILPKPPTRDLLRAVFRRIDERTQAANDAQAPLVVVPDVVVTGDVTLEGALAEAGDAMADAPRIAERMPAVTAPVSSSEFLRDVTVDDDAGSASRGVAWWMVLLAAVAAFIGGMQFSPRGDNATPYVDTLSWALSESVEYPYGEAPFSGARLALLQGLTERLSAAGFKGTLKLEGHAGQFCLLASAGGWRVADVGTALDACDVKGFFSKQEARASSARQSPEFRAWLESPALAASGIRVQVDGVGDERRRTSYPTPDNVSTAGEWNRIAAENNRISLTLIPDA